MSTPATGAENASVFIVGSLVLACSAGVGDCPEAGETIQAHSFVMEAGGKGLNVALALHRLGVPVDGVFALGQDAAGDFIRRAVADFGLAADMICSVEAPTGAGVGLIQADGENRIAVFPGANAALSAAHVHAKADALRRAGLVFAQFEAPDAPIAAAFALARAAGIPTMLNPSPYRTIAPEILAHTDIIVLNAPEAAAVSPDGVWTGPMDRLAGSLSAAGVDMVIVTRGAAGAVLWREGVVIEQPGFAVDPVDSIGAGDAFTGAFIARTLKGDKPATALRWGCAAGALTVTRLGLADALPSASDVKNLLGTPMAAD